MNINQKSSEYIEKPDLYIEDGEYTSRTIAEAYEAGYEQALKDYSYREANIEKMTKRSIAVINSTISSMKNYKKFINEGIVS